jgi:hypothetical protein
MSSKNYDEILKLIPVEAGLIKTFDKILTEFPYLDYKKPLLFLLYLEYNKSVLEQDDFDEIRAIIERLRSNMTVTNDKNRDKKDRHLDAAIDMIDEQKNRLGVYKTMEEPTIAEITVVRNYD